MAACRPRPVAARAVLAHVAGNRRLWRAIAARVPLRVVRPVTGGAIGAPVPTAMSKFAGPARWSAAGRDRGRAAPGSLRRAGRRDRRPLSSPGPSTPVAGRPTYGLSRRVGVPRCPRRGARAPAGGRRSPHRGGHRGPRRTAGGSCDHGRRVRGSLGEGPRRAATVGRDWGGPMGGCSSSIADRSDRPGRREHRAGGGGGRAARAPRGRRGRRRRPSRPRVGAGARGRGRARSRGGGPWRRRASCPLPRVAGRVQGPGGDRASRRPPPDPRRQGPSRGCARAPRRRAHGHPGEAGRRRDRVARHRLGRDARPPPARDAVQRVPAGPPRRRPRRPGRRDRPRDRPSRHAVGPPGAAPAAGRRGAPGRPGRLPRRARHSPAAVVGVSFGGVLAIELAARRPGRVAAVVAYEPPYGAVADAATRAWFGTLAADTAAAYHTGGPPAAAEAFLRAVAGDAAWERLHDRARASLAARATGRWPTPADGPRPDDLPASGAGHDPGGRRERAVYAPIAETLAARIPVPGAIPRRRRPPRPDHRARPRRRRHPSALAAAGLSPTGAQPMTDPRPDVTRPVSPPTPATPRRRRGAGDVRRIAGVYDPMNLAISAFQSRVAAPAGGRRGLEPGGSALDVASAAARWRRTSTRGSPLRRVLGVDISPGMIEVAERRYGGRRASSTWWATPWRCPRTTARSTSRRSRSACATCPTIAAGSRRWRSVRPGGRVLCLEIARPAAAWPGSCAGGSTDRAPDRPGRGAGERLCVLVRSVQNYPSPERIAGILGEAGLVDVSWQGLTGGIVTLHEGTVPDR